MEQQIPYDPDEDLFSPAPDVALLVLSESNSSDILDIKNCDILCTDHTSQSNSNSNSSPSILPHDTFGMNFIENESIDFACLIQPMEKLQILAQPKAFYRERYCSETDPSKKRAQRFIRTDDELSHKYEYPTIQIPSQWRDLNRNLYIRVTLVTVVSENVPVVCIHPYAIDTPETNVIRSRQYNSLYFPVTKEDIFHGEKCFRISRKKMVQHDLKTYGLFHLFDKNQYDIQRVNNIHDAKQTIEIYQLWKSQLVFTITESLDKNFLPRAIRSTSVPSQIMCDEACGRNKEILINHRIRRTISDDDTVKCTPRKGDWMGGDDILMVIPKLDRRKGFNIHFDFGEAGRVEDIQISFVDCKTIFFQTPPCQILIGEHNIKAQIIVTQHDLIIASIDFIYLTPYKQTIYSCSNCQFNMIHKFYSTNNKRPHYLLESTIGDDDGESLIQQMSRLTTEERFVQLNHQATNDDINAKFDKYLLQLQEAIVEFVRTNNPSRLFRRTRILLAKSDGNPPPLDAAIRHGHMDITLKLIEQISDMSPTYNLLERENDDGEIPLLLAAKLNQWNVIEIILKKTFRS